MKIFALLLWLTYTATYAQSWSPLFDGNTLNGWHLVNAGASTFEVKNGEIIGTTIDKNITTHLVTDQQYSDFILEMEVYISEGLNSGIDLRGSYEDGKVYAYQVDVDGWPRKWSGGFYEENGRQWIGIPEINPRAKNALQINQWNTIRIEAFGSTLTSRINGIPILVLIDTVRTRGFISIQIHHAMKPEDHLKTIRWRNIRIQTKNIKPISPTIEAPVINMTDQVSVFEKAQGYRSLIPATGFDGWRSVHSSSPPNKRWLHTNGTFKVEKSDGSETGNDIVTQDQYHAFEFVFDFKLTAGANSGIKYFVDEQYDSGGKSGIGLEYQLLDDELHPDAKEGVVGNRTLASLYDLIPSEKPAPNFRKKIGDWNTGRIIVYPDHRVEHWLNGFKVVEYIRNNNIFKALVARSKYAKYPGFGSAPQGHILLQDHGDAVEFRRMKVREL